MTQNVLQIWPEILGVAVGALILFLFALTVALPHRTKSLPGSSGHREEGEEGVHEEIRADGYIDSFNNTIEEAGGALPLIVRLAIPGIIIWWLIYLILNWTPR
jgi:hypothetical protein